jgi:hypothetical protein
MLFVVSVILRVSPWMLRGSELESGDCSASREALATRPVLLQTPTPSYPSPSPDNENERRNAPRFIERGLDMTEGR